MTSLAYLALLPVFGTCVSFNLPYPAWYASLFGLLCCLSLCWYVERRKAWCILLSGACSGAADSFKPNVGVFALWAVLAVLVAAGGRRTRWEGLLRWVVAALILGGLLTLFGKHLFSANSLFLFAPAILFLVTSLAQRRGETVSRLDTELVVLGAGFLIPTLPWVVYFVSQLGWQDFLGEVFLVGGEVRSIYTRSYPSPELQTVVLCAAIAGLSFAGLLPRLKPGSKAVVFVEVLAVLALGAAICGPWWHAPGSFAADLAMGARLGVGLDGSLSSPAQTTRNIAFYAVPLVHWVALVAWYFGPLRERRSTSLTVLLPFALFGFLEVYPRADYMHLMMAVASTLPLGTFLLVRLSRNFLSTVVPHRWGRHLVSVTVLVAYGMIATTTVRHAGLVYDFSRWTRRDLTSLQLERAGSLEGAPNWRRLSQIRSVTRYVQQYLSPGEALFSFPALTVLNFLSGQPSPVRHDYFFARRPDHREEAEIVDRLREVRPPLIVVTDTPGSFFIDAPVYYFLLRGYVREHYVRARRVGIFEILERRGDSGELERVPIVQKNRVGMVDLKQRFGPMLRHGKNWKVLGRAGTLPEDRVRGVFLTLEQRLRLTPPYSRQSASLIRGLGEWAVPYLLERYAQADRRTKKEIAQVLNVVFLQEMHRRYRLWGSASFPPVEDVELAPSVLALVSRPDLPRRERAAVARGLALLNVRAAIPFLHEALQDQGVRRSAILALAHMDVPSALCRMVEELGDNDWFAQVYYPSVLLSAASRHPDVEACLSSAIREGSGRQREIAAWIAGAVGTSSIRQVLEEALADEDPAVQAAARWSLYARGGEDH
jgi:hypothetical protein